MSDPKKIILGRADRNSLAAGAPKLPSLPTSFGTDPKQMIGAIKEILEVREGQRGSKLDKSLTWRDLFDQGVIALNIDGQAFYNPPGGGIVPAPANGGSIDSTPPPAPTGLEAVGAVATVILKWDQPPANVAYTEIWRSGTNDLGTATKIGTSTSTLYNDVVGSSQIYYYWIRWVTRFPTTGPFNKTEGTEGRTGLDASYILELLAANPPAGVNYNPLLWTNSDPNLTINGVPVPVGVYMTTAYIANGSIGRLQVGLAAIDDARIANLSATKITAGDIDADRMRANIVQAAQGQFATLSALSAYMGQITLENGGWFKTEGVADYNNGTGLYMDRNLFRIGDGNQGLYWDGFNLTVRGNLETTGNGTFHGTFSAGGITSWNSQWGSAGAYVGPEGCILGMVSGDIGTGGVGAVPANALFVDNGAQSVGVTSPNLTITGRNWSINANGYATLDSGWVRGNLSVDTLTIRNAPGQQRSVSMGITLTGVSNGFYQTSFTVPVPTFAMVFGDLMPNDANNSTSYSAVLATGPLDQYANVSGGRIIASDGYGSHNDTGNGTPMPPKQFALLQPNKTYYLGVYANGADATCYAYAILSPQ